MKALRIFFAALLICALGAGSTFAQELTIINSTGSTIEVLGLADCETDEEAVQDLLGSDTLAAGEGLKVNISGSATGWELVAQASKGKHWMNWTNLDLTGVKAITLFADGTAKIE